jgi:hypothetical protein
VDPGGPPPPPETWAQFLERLIRTEGKVDRLAEKVNEEFKEIKEEIENEKKTIRALFDKVYARLQGMDNRLIGVAFTLATSAVVIALTVVLRT